MKSKSRESNVIEIEIPFNGFAAENLEFIGTLRHEGGELLAKNAFQVVGLLHRN